jgi:hypothetical protein
MSYLGIRGVECHSSSKVMLDIGCNWGLADAALSISFRKMGERP